MTLQKHRSYGGLSCAVPGVILQRMVLCKHHKHKGSHQCGFSCVYSGKTFYRMVLCTHHKRESSHQCGFSDELSSIMPLRMMLHIRHSYKASHFGKRSCVDSRSINLQMVLHMIWQWASHHCYQGGYFSGPSQATLQNKVILVQIKTSQGSNKIWLTTFKHRYMASPQCALT